MIRSEQIQTILFILRTLNKKEKKEEGGRKKRAQETFERNVTDKTPIQFT